MTHKSQDASCRQLEAENKFQKQGQPPII